MHMEIAIGVVGTITLGRHITLREVIMDIGEDMWYGAGGGCIVLTIIHLRIIVPTITILDIITLALGGIVVTTTAGGRKYKLALVETRPGPLFLFF